MLAIGQTPVHVKKVFLFAIGQVAVARSACHLEIPTGAQVAEKRVQS